MASETESDADYRRVTPVAWVLAPYSMGTWMRQWFRVWRWPAGVVAGLVLWLALVAVVGAATSVGNPPSLSSSCDGLAGSMDRTIMRMS
ncbi:MAG TPA: hypothetical protein VGR42_07950 [Casimicrobiaceae bacterium]|nr:hypothetical protein [Casimicrobiaceae bacterium]